MHFTVEKKTLNNGLSILVVPNKKIPKVSLQLWYNVGSKHENSGERGLAHLIEHMIFKGTATLSESDINLITHKLSGVCNAFTSFDYTGYLFDLPSQHWHEALTIMADCMRNCTFKEDLLASEMKAVIQELKMYNDDYDSLLVERMMGAIFQDHPYHYPIIGFKQDLWNAKRENLVAFYARHYIPNNATLVVVGDIDPGELYAAAEAAFGHIQSDYSHKHTELYHKLDIESTHITLRRDIQQPTLLYAWLIPGAQEGKDYLLDILAWIIGSSKGARLYKLLVEELMLATNVECVVNDLFESSMFFIQVTPVENSNKEAIQQAILNEIASLAQQGPHQKELDRAVRKTEMDFLSLTESNQRLAYLIGKYFLATGNENYLTTYTNYPRQNIASDIKKLVQQYLQPHIMHTGEVQPLSATDKEYWKTLQARSDQEDNRILAGIQRTTAIEEGESVHRIEAQPPRPFSYPHATKWVLDNGLTVLHHHDATLDKVDLILDLKARHWHDPEGREGLINFMSDLLEEGTEHYTSQELAYEFESLGMTFSAMPGQFSLNMLSSDVERGFSLLFEILTNAVFPVDAVERVRTQLLADCTQLWDDPSQFVGQLAKEAVYKQHPYHKNILGTKDTLLTISRDELIEAYRTYVTPQDGRLAIVGNVDQAVLQKTLEKTLAQWHGKPVEPIKYPTLHKLNAYDINYPINRDQVVLCYAGLSVDRLHEDYDKLLLFDQIFSGGVLGSMSSKLFDLREQSGLFYTIGGSLIARADKQPGLMLIKTIVSNDRLDEAEKSIETVIDTAIDTVTDNEFQEAQQAIINALVDHFAANRDMAATFIAIERLGLPDDYFVNRANQIIAISKNEMHTAVKKWLNAKNLVKIRAGRF